MSPPRGSALSERDIDVLRLLLRFRLLSGTQLQRLVVTEGSHTTRARRTRAVLQRLTHRGVVARLRRRIGGIRAGSEGTVYRLTTRGLSVLNRVDGIQRRRIGGEPGERYVRHVLAVSEQFVRAHEYAHRTSGQLLSFEAEPRCWRSFAESLGSSTTLRPDAFVHTAAGEYEYAAFLEVDLATESPSTVARKCRAYIAYWRSGIEQRRLGVFPKVLWIVPNARRRQQVETVIGRMPQETRLLFAVATENDATAIVFGHEMGGTQ